MTRSTFTMALVLAAAFGVSCGPHDVTPPTTKPTAPRTPPDSIREIKLDYPVGFVTAKGVSETIPSGKALPLKSFENFCTKDDNQTRMVIRLAQPVGGNESEVATVEIDGLPPKPKYEILLKVTLSVDIKKQLRVTATSTADNFKKEYGPFAVK